MNDIKVPPFTDGQKQLIEMTEKLAEKRGGKICDVDGIDDDITDIKELLEDTIKRIEEPTNYDWLRSLNTEQLAEVLLHIADSCYWAGFFKGKDDDDCYDDEYCLINQNILEWLKEKHE